MSGLLTLSKPVLSTFMIPLVAGTMYWTWYMDQNFTRPSQYVTLDSICEVQRGELDEMDRLREGEHATISERLIVFSPDAATIPSEIFQYSNLSRRRYAQNDETLYVAPEDDRTDYVGAVIIA